MVAVPSDHFQNVMIEPFAHLRRVLQKPTGGTLLENQQADLIAQVELAAMCHSRDKADHVATMTLQLSMSLRSRPGSAGT